MTEATCQMDYVENWQLDYASTMMRYDLCDKAQISIHPVVLHYTDEDEDMKVLSFAGISGIMTHSVLSKTRLS